MAQPLLSVENLRIEFPTRHGTLLAIDDASFHIDEGEILGVVGESGAGKSITGMSIIGLLDPPGRIAGGPGDGIGGRIGAVAAAAFGRVFHDGLCLPRVRDRPRVRDLPTRNGASTGVPYDSRRAAAVEPFLPGSRRAGPGKFAGPAGCLAGRVLGGPCPWQAGRDLPCIGGILGRRSGRRESAQGTSRPGPGESTSRHNA